LLVRKPSEAKQDPGLRFQVSGTRPTSRRSELVGSKMLDCVTDLAGEFLRDLSLLIHAHVVQFLTRVRPAPQTSLLGLTVFLSLRPKSGPWHLFGHDVSRLPRMSRVA